MTPYLLASKLCWELVTSNLRSATKSGMKRYYLLGAKDGQKSRILLKDYAHPEALATTEWVSEHIDDPTVKLVEINVDNETYESGHIQGAVSFDWRTQLQDQLIRDIIQKEAFEKLVGEAGISPNDTVVLYGDHNNWFAAYGFWLFKYYGHQRVKLLNGGRTKWLKQPGLRFAQERPHPVPVEYKAKTINASIRMRLPELLESVEGKKINLVDVRNREEYSGRIRAPQGMKESAQRGGHIPGAVNVPWCAAINDDGTFISINRLTRLYLDRKKLDPDKCTIPYCNIGERSSHTWFTLKYLLGFEDVRNYDGSWTEYGNRIGLPIER